MADAKIIIEAISDNTGIKELSNALADAQGKLKETQKQLRAAEKAGNLTDSQMKELRAEFARQKLTVGQLNKELKSSASVLTGTGKAANETKSALSNMVTDKLGIDIAGLTSKFTGVGAAMATVATSAAAVSASLVKSARDISNYSNQFISFAANAEHAKKIYDEFNQVYRNTDYDEQKVYDMGKSLLAVGINAKESAALIQEVADTAASLGKGVEFADELTAAFRRLKTGGELTERQYKSLAEAGIDLTDIQEEMRAGGVEAYEALKEKLLEYEGGMDRTKQTAAAMEGDITGNIVEIGRQTALLVDEFFGFSAALKEFYQWVINASQSAIDSIKGMIAAMHGARVAGDAYAAASEEWEKNYAEIWEEKRDQYRNEEEWEAARAAAVAAYANASADVVKEAEAEKQAAIEQTKETSIKAVESIAKTSGGGSGSTKDTTGKDNAAGYKAILKSQNEVIANEKAIRDLQRKGVEIQQQMSLIGVTDSERLRMEGEYKLANLADQLAAEEALSAQRIANYEELIAYTEGHPFDGSDTVLQNLSAQMEQESTLHELRVANLNELIELQKKQNEYDLLQDSIKLNTVKQQWNDYARSVSSSIGQAVGAVVSGQKSMGQAIKEMARQLISNAFAMLAQWTALVAILAAFQDPTPARHASIMMFGNDGTYVKGANGGYTKAGKMATGGLVTGAGTATSDSIPTMLSNGEFVMNAAAVNAIGADNLERMNAAGDNAEGISASGQSVTLNINTVDASGFGDFLNRGGLKAIKQALYDDERSFGAVSVW